MAIFYLKISSISRAAGRRATAAAAPTAPGSASAMSAAGSSTTTAAAATCCTPRSFCPAQYAGTPLEWARNRERLWNTAEHAEKRHNARVAREFQVTLPAELPPIERA